MRFVLVLLGLLLTCNLDAKETPQAILNGLPQAIAGCERSEFRDYGNPKLGGSVAYQSPGFVITVYAYDQGEPHIADGITDRAVTESLTMAKKDIETAQSKGVYSDAQFRSEGKATYNGGFETLCARYRLTFAQGKLAGVKVFSEIHVFGARDHIIKLRISGKLDEEEKLGKVLDQFIPALMKAIQQP